MSNERHVVVIGGGLAGMTVAKELAERGVRVTILEAGLRLGGKAGADERLLPGEGGERAAAWVDHGYHIFPGWYRNVRRLLRELGILGRLLDTNTLYVLARPERSGTPPRVYAHHSFTSIRALLHNVFETILPWHLSFMSFFSMLDLTTQSYSLRGFLDRVSVSGFFRSRFYRHEAIANFHQQTVLQASAIPFYELSAMTMQKIVKAFMGTPSPMLSMFDDDLQTAFIEPFRARLVELGVKISTSHAVTGFEVAGDRATMVNATKWGDEPDDFDDPGDAYVVTVPHDTATSMVSPTLFEREKSTLETEDGAPLAGLWHLSSSPMAAMQVYFDRRLPNVPRWHTNLHESKYGMSFIDISQHWIPLRDQPRTVLAVIASNFKPLVGLPEPEQVRHLLAELLDFVGFDAAGEPLYRFDAEDGFLADGGPMVEAEAEENCGFRTIGADIRLHWQPNVQTPLFLNTSGAWRHRPGSRTALSNVYIAGDYCRSEADLTCMEGAVMSGLATARDILEDFGLPHADVAPLKLELPPRWQLVALKWAALPLWLPLGLYYAIQRWTAPDLSGVAEAPRRRPR